MNSGIFKAIGKFQNASGEPLTGEDYLVKLYDKDPLFDDFLGEAKLRPDGTAEILIFVADMYSVDSPEEREPDLYFQVFHGGKKIFQSEVLENVSFEGIDPVTEQPNSLTREFGPYTVS